MKAPNFGFKVEVVQKAARYITVYGGYGFRVMEIRSGWGRKIYQLRSKPTSAKEWGLFGTYRRVSEVRRRVKEMVGIDQLNASTLKQVA